MEIHADLSRRAVVDTTRLEWTPSPLPGVERRMIERDGEEVARATSIVRYSPGSSFSPHSHGGGEEFLVLAGVFSDETGDFPAGMYVRNPPGSEHRPSSDEGCEILVKLRQMKHDDRAFVRVDTTDDDLWRESRPGERVLELYRSEAELVEMLSFTAGTVFESDFERGAEYFVLEGSFRDQDGSYGEGTWLRLPPGTKQRAEALGDVLVLRKSEHL